MKATFYALAATYGFLTPDLWRETVFTKSPLQEYSDFLAKVNTWAESNQLMAHWLPKRTSTDWIGWRGVFSEVVAAEQVCCARGVHTPSACLELLSCLPVVALVAAMLTHPCAAHPPPPPRSRWWARPTKRPRHARLPAPCGGRSSSVNSSALSRG